MQAENTFSSPAIGIASPPGAVTAPGGEQSGPLGIYGNIATPPTPDLSRSDRLKRRYRVLNYVRELLPHFAIRNCLRVPISSSVSVLYRPGDNRAHFDQLQTCKSVHVCPCCAPVIVERRRAELDQAVTSHLAAGGGLLFATFTLQHQHTDPLSDIDQALRDSFRWLKKGASWRRFADGLGILGSVAATEHTHGQHGWHPHKHVLFFTQGPLSARQLAHARVTLRQRWHVAVARLSHFAHPLYGVDVQSSTDGRATLASYLAKAGSTWGLADELTRANTKQARRAGRTPAALLADYAEGDTRAGALFQEYAEQTYRKNHLVWSRGLRAALGLDEDKSDADVFDEAQQGSHLVVLFSRDQWYVILGNDARAEVLECVEDDQGGIARLVDFLAGLGITLTLEQLDPLRETVVTD